MLSVGLVVIVGVAFGVYFYVSGESSPSPAPQQPGSGVSGFGWQIAALIALVIVPFTLLRWYRARSSRLEAEEPLNDEDGVS